MLIERDKATMKKALSNYNFDHLKPPPEIYENIIPQNEYFVKMSSGEPRRKIFYRVPFTQKQEQEIALLKKNFDEYNIFEKFPDEVLLKHLYAGGFKLEKVMERLKKLQEFHNSPVITNFSERTLTGLKGGCIYTYGRDKSYRPIIIVRADKFDLNLSVEENFNIVYFLMLVVLGYRMVPYHAEKYILLFDLNDMALTQIPFKHLLEIMNAMTVYYSAFVEKTFLYNTKGIGWLWTIGKKFIPEHARSKIKFIEKGKQSQILQYVEEYEMEVKYGGKLQNLKEYWPPKATNEEFDCFRMERHEETETDFLSIKNDTQFFVEKSQVLCDACNCNIF